MCIRDSYEDDIESLKEDIEGVRADIPKFPKWINEVNEVPDFSWIGKTFSVIDDDFIKVGDNLKSLRDRIDLEVNELSESLETKDFEKRVEINEVKENLKETKDKNHRFVDLWWKNKNFKMPVEISYDGIDGKIRRRLEINNEPKRVALLTDSKYRLDPDSWLLFSKNQR